MLDWRIDDVHAFDYEVLTTTGLKWTNVNFRNMSGKFIFLYSECVHSKAGWEYIGNRRTTKYGLECQRWDRQSPHTHTYQSLGNQKNFCRNLANDKEEEVGPWCFTVDPDIRWQTCGIPLCCKWILVGYLCNCVNPSGRVLRTSIMTIHM